MDIHVVLHMHTGNFTYILPPKIEVRHVTGSYSNLFPNI
jgi:hypothetical protein